MATPDDFVGNDMSGQDEAMTVAVDKRKFLLKRLLEDEGIVLSSDEDQSIDVLFMWNKNLKKLYRIIAIISQVGKRCAKIKPYYLYDRAAFQLSVFYTYVYARTSTCTQFVFNK